jgi:hypothetical protein
MINIVQHAISTLLNRLGYVLLRTGTFKSLVGNRAQGAGPVISRSDRMLSHDFVHGRPNVRFSAYELEATEDDVRIASRLLKAYHHAMRDEATAAKTTPDDLWKDLKQGKHREFIQLLAQNDPGALAAHLCNMSRHDITHGMAQGHDLYQAIRSDKSVHNRFASYYIERLVRLGETLGCLPYENPESGKWGENLYTDIDELMRRIEAVTGIDVTPPRISGGLYGIVSSKGSFQIRDITSLYTAWRIRQILKHHQSPSICEIGAGTGRTAYYCHKLGITKVTIFDLPYVCVLSGYYLLKGLPDAPIQLYGEPAHPASDAINILPYWCVKTVPDNAFDLTLNQDSFPEIDRETVLEYLRQIRRHTKQYFLSINQEGQAPQTGTQNLQLVISHLVGDLGNTYARVYRFPYWVREGYVEELFQIVKP